MTSFAKLPAGVRLDAWPESPLREAVTDAPEVVELKAELRRRMPQFVGMLEMLNRLRPLQDLAGRLAGPAQAQVLDQRD